MNSNVELHSLSDKQLTDSLVNWHGQERTAHAAVIAHLAEVERRELHLARGYPSLFAFCTDALGMSEDVAGTRIAAVRVVRNYPYVLEMLADGRLYVSGIRLLRPHLTPDNAQELLESAAGLSKREIERLVARRFPKPDVKPSVRKLPRKQRTTQIPAMSTDDDVLPGDSKTTLDHREHPEPNETVASLPSPIPAEPVSASQRPEQQHNRVTPLSATRYKVTFTASEELVAKLEQAKALLSHAVPDQNTEAVILRALTVLVETEEKRRFGAPQKAHKWKDNDSSDSASEPATPSPSLTKEDSSTPECTDTAAPSRHITASVRREVYERDGHRCTYESPGGKRCTETRFLEFDHVNTPWAHGGASTADNLTLRCSAHNRWTARKLFGNNYVEARIRESRHIEEDAPAEPHEHKHKVEVPTDEEATGNSSVPA